MRCFEAQKRLIGVVAAPRSNEDETENGIVLAPTTFHQEWMGQVFAVGRDVRDHGVGFGDFVMLSKWTSGVEHGWWHDYIELWQGYGDPDAEYYFLNPDDRTQAVKCTGRDTIVWLRPQQIIFKTWSYRDALADNRDKIGIFPLSDRLLTKHEDLASKSEGGIDLVHLNRHARNPVAKILAVGPKVDKTQFPVGWYCIVPERAFTAMCTTTDGSVYTFVLSGEVPLVADSAEKAFDKVEFVHAETG